jgi:NAD-dependent SIR2 family protein deacetylase
MLCARIINGDFKNIVVLTGAGISTNAGIPDYRSNKGILETFIKDGLTDEIKNIIIKAEPTSGHKFCKYLYDKGWLRRVYTQNIDGLHQKVGLPEEFVIEYHGSVHKNNIISYNQKISENVIKQTIEDFTNDIDLIIVMGTSLQVAPFCALPNLVNKKCVRALINIHPEHAYTNDFHNNKRIINGIDSNVLRQKSYVKFGKRVVTLRQSWNNKSKWSQQYIIKSDIDDWCNQFN